MLRMENKYYTPSIEEFHVGFGFEGYNTASNYPYKDKWVEFTMGLGLGEQWNSIEDYINNNQIRVKYLDKEDIESLGFRFGEVSKKEVNGETIDLSTKGDKYIIHAVGEYNRDKLFEGTIKNKSELKVLLKQLGIDD